jgi:4-amino-4-deoxy-L-arabinose transferase-like glycosyltransferase
MKRFSSALSSDTGILTLIALAFLIFHVLTNGQYGFHRDELQTLDDARHLDWGYVVYPPITPLLARLELTLFGTSLIGFRFFAAVAVSIVSVLAGLMARELGGSRGAQILAAVSVAVSPFALTQAAVMQYVSFDYLWGVLATYFLVRLLKSGDPRWWVAIGVTLGLGMETRYTMGFLALGIVAAVLLTPARRYLLGKWLWIGVALSLLIFLPNLIWQARHGFISLDFLRHLHARDLRQGRYHGFYREQLLVNVNVVTAPLALLGLWFYIGWAEARRYRMLGWTLAVTFALFAIAGARSYYTAPLYPALLAGGCVFFGIWLSGARPLWRRTVYGAQWALLLVGGISFALLAVPLAPIGSRVWQVTAKVHDQFREEVGWPELAHAVAGVYASLPPQERAHTGILTGNYGEAGALNLYGPALGLPRAMSLTNSFWYRGYDPRLPQTVIVTGFGLDEAQKLFASCVVAAKNTNPYNVENEESRDHPDILLCQHLKMPWPVYWSHFRRYG